MQSIFKIALPVLLAGTIATACQTVQTTHGGAVGVQRSQLMMVSAQEVEQASNQQYQQMVAEARSKNALDRDPATVQRVRRIVSRLAAQTGAFRTDAPSWSWEVHVFSSSELNAWCMAGGKMAIYTGLIERLALTDDEIAAVMGHEIAHALREHARERVSKSMATGL
ncbi:MAG TPA: M48 family metalloprotease, partial [Thauera aminoaromatica]|nr:M48 family metalloprotease [Thauera aminoaromatica]